MTDHDAPPSDDAATTGGHYTVLARRYRPQTFDEVIGQGHVARALTNAIRGGRVAHAYLFTGARGVGKTSTARIFAKALNCPNAATQGPDAGVPCNRCEVCAAVGAGQDVDVLEIDGASNRGIDDVRAVRANVNIRPMRSPYKVYIVDEVHMLSRDAFNALLKTLEEPPPNVKFVFCTTEPNKLPDTILSRVQRFDFATVETQNIIERLASIAATEGFAVEQAALELVARRAAGSMRDSQSLFDQLLAFGGEAITADDVHRLFGTASDDRLVTLTGHLTGGRPAEALDELEAALGEGVQLEELVDQLVAVLRDLMVLSAGATNTPLLGVATEHRAALARLVSTPGAGAWGVRTVLAALQILSEAKLRMQRVTFGRALAEGALVRCAMLGDLDDIAALAATLRDGGSPTRTPASSARPPARAPQHRVGGPATQKKTAEPAADSPARPKPPVNRLNGTAALPEPAVAPPSMPDAGLPAEPVGSVPLEPGTEDAWMGRLREGRFSAQMAALVGLAIPGPNRLELRFDPNLPAAAERIERKKADVERSVAELTGTPASVTVRTATPAAPPAGPPGGRSTGGNGVPRPHPAPRPSPAPRTSADPSRPTPLDPGQIDDPFVRRAAEIFEARRITRELLPTPPPRTAVPVEDDGAEG